MSKGKAGVAKESNAASRDAIFTFFLFDNDCASVFIERPESRRISNFWPQTDTNGRIDAI